MDSEDRMITILVCSLILGIVMVALSAILVTNIRGSKKELAFIENGYEQIIVAGSSYPIWQKAD